MKTIKYNGKDSIQVLLENSQFEYKQVNKSVEAIINNVKTFKDKAVKEYTSMFDKVEVQNFKVTQDEIEQAVKNISDELYQDVTNAYNNIAEFHRLQLPEDFKIQKGESYTGQMIRAIERVAMYVPGGTAAYPSTVLMNAAPAKIAGVEKLVMITPPNKEGKVDDILLVAAKVAGVDEIYKVGGAQAIAAVTYGTETIPAVDKIVGPGNIYVAIAKKMVSGYVGIDMIAGPSEVVVIADDNSKSRYIAADLMAQAEHDELAKVVLITTSTTLAKEVLDEIDKQKQVLEREKIIDTCLKDNGYIVTVDSIEEGIEVSNLIAPEHLELQFEDAESYLPNVINAGAIFLGEYTPEPVGDYYAGPNHTLPTSGTARFSSALSTLDFVKRISLIKYSKKSLDESKDSIIRIAEKEGLTAHANAIKVRYQ